MWVLCGVGRGPEAAAVAGSPNRGRVHGYAAVMSAQAEYPIRLTAVFEDGGADNGWVTAWIREIPSVITQGRDLDDARDMLRSALAEYFHFYVEQEGEAPGAQARSEPFELVLREAS